MQYTSFWFIPKVCKFDSNICFILLLPLTSVTFSSFQWNFHLETDHQLLIIMVTLFDILCHTANVRFNGYCYTLDNMLIIRTSDKKSFLPKVFSKRCTSVSQRPISPSKLCFNLALETKGNCANCKQ